MEACLRSSAKFGPSTQRGFMHTGRECSLASNLSSAVREGSGRGYRLHFIADAGLL